MTRYRRAPRQLGRSCGNEIAGKRRSDAPQRQQMARDCARRSRSRRDAHQKHYSSQCDSTGSDTARTRRGQSSIDRYWHMFSTGESYRELGGNYYSRRNLERCTTSPTSPKPGETAVACDETATAPPLAGDEPEAAWCRRHVSLGQLAPRGDLRASCVQRLAGADDRRGGVLVHAMGLAELGASRPAAASASRNSCSVSAPAMQPVQACMSALVCSSMSGSAITSETANRPPGRSTRAASASTLGLSPERLITQLEITTSTLASGSGSSSR